MKLYTKKNCWEQHMGIRLPNTNWFGLLSLLFMVTLIVSTLSKNGFLFDVEPMYLNFMVISLLIFLTKGFVYFYTLQKEEKEE